MPDHTDPEAEYFAREDQQKKAALADTVAREKAEQERAAAKALHAGHCGKCGGTFTQRGFRGVEIDVCTGCGAVLLDPGELELVAGKDETGVIKSLASIFSFRRDG